MPRYKLKLEYDGTGFAGMQKQPGMITVQETVETAIFGFSREIVNLYAAGRTDKGVHALGQIVHFDLNKYFEPAKLVYAINHYLQGYKVVVLNAEIVDDNFHARFSAKERSYTYIILNRIAPSVIDFNRVWHIREKLDINLMQEAANKIIGTHDFTSFRAAMCQSLKPIKTINNLQITKEGEYIFINISAISFLYHMVRNIVGTLRFIGNKKWPPEKIVEILLAKNRAIAGPTAPACGLYFKEVLY